MHDVLINKMSFKNISCILLWVVTLNSTNIDFSQSEYNINGQQSMASEHRHIQYWQHKFTQYLNNHPTDDGSHDISHFFRVYETAKQILANENANQLVLLTACYFHDIVNLPKNHPDRKRASTLAGDKAIEILKQNFPEFPSKYYAEIHHDIAAHSYSANITPETIEAKALQDADRIDAIGAIGLARVFYIAGRLNQSLFDANDMFGDQRDLNDKQFALDHFQLKLLKVPETMQTEVGKKIAVANTNFLVEFMAKLSHEVQGKHLTTDETVYEKFKLT